MNTRIPIICIVVLSIVTFIPHVSACSCAAEWNIEDDFAANDNVIFSGKVINIKEQQRTFLVTFEIDQSWKGIPDDITDINTMTSQSSSSCGYNFAEEQSYLVVAYGNWDQTPNVSLCDSTMALAFAQEQISFLSNNTQSESSKYYQLDEPFEIKMNQKIQFRDLELHFYDIEDSRCPLDVTCVWEGKVTVMINIKNQTHKIGGMFPPGYTISYLSPYEITLVDIQPHPIRTEDAEFVATLEISILPDRESLHKG